MRGVSFLAFAAILLSVVSCRSSRSVEVTGRDSMRIEAVREVRALAVMSDSLMEGLTLTVDTVEIADREGRRVRMTGVAMRRDRHARRAAALSVASCDTIAASASRAMEAVGKETASVVAPSREWLWGVVGLMLLAAVILVRRW